MFDNTEKFYLKKASDTFIVTHIEDAQNDDEIFCPRKSWFFFAQFYLGRSIICIYAYTTILLFFLVEAGYWWCCFKGFAANFSSSIYWSLSISMYVKLMSVRVENGNLKWVKKMDNYWQFPKKIKFYLSKIHHFHNNLLWKMQKKVKITQGIAIK